MNLKKKVFLLTSVVLSILIVFTGCSSFQAPAGNESSESTTAAPTVEGISGSIVAVGSSAMQPLVEEAANSFMAKNAKAQIQVQGGGSGTGISQVSSGGADIGNSDVFAVEKLKDNPEMAEELVDHKICVVGMGAVAHKEVGVDNVTKQQLIDIFTGKITNWKEIGGNDMKIVLVNRPSSSGTRATFKNFALDGAEEAEGITEESSGTVKKIVSETPGSIGYLAFSYYDDSILALNLDGIAPTEENVTNGSYPVWAYQHSYTKGEPTGLAKAFLDFMMGDEVQNTIIPELGYISSTKMQVERDVDGNVTKK